MGASLMFLQDELKSAARLVTMTIFGYKPGKSFWALAEIGLARPGLERTAGLHFWKLLGAGASTGFSLRLNGRRYGCLRCGKCLQQSMRSSAPYG